MKVMAAAKERKAKAEKNPTPEEDMVRIATEADTNKRKESETKLSCSWMKMDWTTLQKNIGIVLVRNPGSTQIVFVMYREVKVAMGVLIYAQSCISLLLNEPCFINCVDAFDTIRDICVFNSRFMN